MSDYHVGRTLRSHDCNKLLSPLPPSAVRRRSLLHPLTWKEEKRRNEFGNFFLSFTGNEKYSVRFAGQSTATVFFCLQANLKQWPIYVGSDDVQLIFSGLSPLRHCSLLVSKHGNPFASRSLLCRVGSIPEIIKRRTSARSSSQQRTANCWRRGEKSQITCLQHRQGFFACAERAEGWVFSSLEKFYGQVAGFKSFESLRQKLELFDYTTDSTYCILMIL